MSGRVIVTAMFERGAKHGEVARFKAPGAPKRLEVTADGGMVPVAPDKQDGGPFYQLAKWEDGDRRGELLALYIFEGPPVCDFCSAAEAVWDYPCEDFTVEFGDKPTFQSTGGGFAACEECAELVAADDVKGLVARAVAMFDAQHPRVRDSLEFRASFQRIAHEFFRTRTGPRVPADQSVVRLWER